MDDKKVAILHSMFLFGTSINGMIPSKLFFDRFPIINCFLKESSTIFVLTPPHLVFSRKFNTTTRPSYPVSTAQFDQKKLPTDTS